MASGQNVTIALSVAGQRQAVAAINQVNHALSGMTGALGQITRISSGVFLGTLVSHATMAGIRNLESGIKGLARSVTESVADYERLGLIIKVSMARETSAAAAARGEVLSVKDAYVTAGKGIDKYLKQVQDLSLTRPVKEKDIADVYRILAGYQMGTKASMAWTKALTDYALAAGREPEEVTRLALAMGQMQAKGKLAGEEMRQFTNAGITMDIIIAGLNKKFPELGINAGNFYKEMKDGNLTTDKVLPALFSQLTEFEGIGTDLAKSWAGIPVMFQNISRVVKRTLFGAAAKEIGRGLFSVIELFNPIKHPETLRGIQTLGRGISDFLIPMIDRVIAATSNMQKMFQGLSFGSGWTAIYNALQNVQEGKVTLGVDFSAQDVLQKLKDALGISDMTGPARDAGYWYGKNILGGILNGLWSGAKIIGDAIYQLFTGKSFLGTGDESAGSKVAKSFVIGASEGLAKEMANIAGMPADYQPTFDEGMKGWQKAIDAVNIALERASKTAEQLFILGSVVGRMGFAIALVGIMKFSEAWNELFQNDAALTAISNLETAWQDLSQSISPTMSTISTAIGTIGDYVNKYIVPIFQAWVQIELHALSIFGSLIRIGASFFKFLFPIAQVVETISQAFKGASDASGTIATTIESTSGSAGALTKALQVIQATAILAGMAITFLFSTIGSWLGEFEKFVGSIDEKLKNIANIAEEEGFGGLAGRLAKKGEEAGEAFINALKLKVYELAGTDWARDLLGVRGWGPKITEMTPDWKYPGRNAGQGFDYGYGKNWETSPISKNMEISPDALAAMQEFSDLMGAVPAAANAARDSLDITKGTDLERHSPSVIEQVLDAVIYRLGVMIPGAASIAAKALKGLSVSDNKFIAKMAGGALGRLTKGPKNAGAGMNYNQGYYPSLAWQSQRSGVTIDPNTITPFGAPYGQPPTDTGNADIFKGIFDDLGDSAGEAANKLQQAADKIGNLISGALSPSGDQPRSWALGTSMEGQLSKDAWDEPARRWADVAARGKDSKWFEFFRDQIPADIIDMGGEQLKGFAKWRQDEFYKDPAKYGADPALVMENIRTQLMAQQNQGVFAGQVAQMMQNNPSMMALLQSQGYDTAGLGGFITQMMGGATGLPQMMGGMPGMPLGVAGAGAALNVATINTGVITAGNVPTEGIVGVPPGGIPPGKGNFSPMTNVSSGMSIEQIAQLIYGNTNRMVLLLTAIAMKKGGGGGGGGGDGRAPGTFPVNDAGYSGGGSIIGGYSPPAKSSMVMSRASAGSFLPRSAVHIENLTVSNNMEAAIFDARVSQAISRWGDE